jgi:endonuclease/exonuclease/phosphatase (EEP) superfamily protein YafD
VNVAAIAPWHGSGNPAAPAAAPTLRIVSFNVDVANRRFAALEPLIGSLHPDIIGLTEVTPAWARAAATASAKVPARRLLPRSDAYGIGLLSGPRPTAVTARRFPSGGPLALIAHFRVAGLPLTFVLLHAHTSFAGSIHVRELRALAAELPKLGRRLVVCGDFNTVPWSAQFGEFAETAGLRDASAGSWPAYSWPAWSPLLRVPLDHCLVSDGISVRSRSFGPSSGSDHFPLIVDLALVPLGR